MFINELYQGGVRALLHYDSTIFDGMTLPAGVDPQAVVDHIIFKYGDAPLFSPDPAVVKYYISIWSARRLSLWERYKAAIETEYKPLQNYDRTDEGNIEYSPETTREYQISADNASTYQPDRKELADGKDTTKTALHSYGNIGVTTSQQMLEAELDLVPRLDLLDYIADDWHIEFNLMMYN